jgi:hypothetical protein
VDWVAISTWTIFTAPSTSLARSVKSQEKTDTRLL